MSRLLSRIGIPAGIIASIFGATWWAQKMRWIPEEVQYWLWPTLVALALLAGMILALRGQTRFWAWPFGVGFVVQLIGLMLVLSEDIESGWEAFGYTLGAIALVLLIMGVVWLVNYIRARSLERKMAEGMAEGQPGNEAELGRIRKDMMDALSLLRRAGSGRNAIYELPWFLVMGRPAAGKTVAIKNSGLGLPVRKDWVKGVGGTYTADWFFTNDLIFLDTPGKWVSEGTDEAGKKQWKQLMRLLGRHRGRRPLDGLVVVVPADDLMSSDEDELEEQAGNIRDVIDLIHDELHFRFPVYLLVSKCDLVEGFVEFFRGLPAKRRHEILGWSNDDPNDKDAVGLIEKGFKRVQRRLEAYRLEMLGRIASRTQARRLFFFSEEFKALQEPLRVFADTFFQADRFHEAPVFRGFYFTSGTQEGAPLSKAISAMARTLGVSAPLTKEADEDEPKRSYFLLDLFRELMVGDQGLVGRTAGHWWRQRRNTALGAFAPAGIAGIFLLLALVSFTWNRSIYHTYGDEAKSIVNTIEEDYARDPLAVGKLLDQTERLRQYHRKMVWGPLRGFGMRRPKQLEQASFDLFAGKFSENVLRPTLSAAAERASNGSCVDRLDMLHSVVYLRMGRRFKSETDLAGFEQFWSDGSSEVDAGDRLLQQYRYYKQNRDSDGDPLLPGFSLREVASGIADDCKEAGATQVLRSYLELQETCRTADLDAEFFDCGERLHKILQYNQEKSELFVTHFKNLKTDLDELARAETEVQAQQAYDYLSKVPLPGTESDPDDCFADFGSKYIALLSNYAVHEELLNECRSQALQKTDRSERWKVRSDYFKRLKEQMAKEKGQLPTLLDAFNKTCGPNPNVAGTVEISVLQEIAERGFKVRCTGSAPSKTVEPKAYVRKPEPRRTQPGRPKPQRKKVSRTTQWFTLSAPVPRSYTLNVAREKIQEWEAQGQADPTREEQNRIRGEADAYGRGYAEAWRRYLDGLRLQKSNRGPIEWLQALANTSEYQDLIEPAATAADLEPEMSRLKIEVRGLGRLDRLGGFVDSDIQEYQKRLAEVADDLQKCEERLEEFTHYKQEVSNKDKNNSLVAAEDWVASNVPTELRGIFLEPLEAARSFVQSTNLVEGYWQELGDLFDRNLGDRAPFDGPVGELDVVAEESLVGMFGGETGMVATVLRSSGSSALPQESLDWLARAERVSSLLFESKKDDFRSHRIGFRMDPTLIVYDPPKKEAKVQLIGLKIILDDQEISLDPENPNPQVLKLNLFDPRELFCSVHAVVRIKKGTFSRVVGANWKDDSIEPAKSSDGSVAEIDGEFAALRLLELGAKGASESGTVTYVVEVPVSEKKTVKMTIPLEFSGADIPELLKLMREGLNAPPAFSGG